MATVPSPAQSPCAPSSCFHSKPPAPTPIVDVSPNNTSAVEVLKPKAEKAEVQSKPVLALEPPPAPETQHRFCNSKMASLKSNLRRARQMVHMLGASPVTQLKEVINSHYDYFSKNADNKLNASLEKLKPLSKFHRTMQTGPYHQFQGVITPLFSG